YIVSLALFTLGSCLSGLSWNVNSLIAARIIQAIGGGIMQPVGMAFLYRVTPRAKMGVVMGIYGIAAMAAPAIGPTMGGYMVEYINWRLIFYINVPIGIINLFLAAALLKETDLIPGKYFDWVGLVTSVVGLSCLLMALSQANKYGWTSVYIVSLIVVAVITLSILIHHELNHPEPLLDLRLFKYKIYAVTTVISAVINVGMFSAMFLVPILLQNVIGMSALETGLLMFPAAVVSAAMMPISGRMFDKYGARGVAIVGLGIFTLGTFMMCKFNDVTPFSVMIIWLMVRGAGMGLSMMPVTTAGMNTLPRLAAGRASALGNVVRQVASSFGIAVFTTIMQHRQVFHFSNLANSINLTGNDALAIQSTLKNMAINNGWSASTTQYMNLALIYKQIVKMSTISAITDCFIIAAGVTVVAIVLVFFFRDINTTEVISHETNHPVASAKA
ncbi:MAG: DHA2 family efflux MFS transporter permease subunit, partial [Ignavibacteriales bacterium]